MRGNASRSMPGVLVSLTVASSGDQRRRTRYKIPRTTLIQAFSPSKIDNGVCLCIVSLFLQRGESREIVLGGGWFRVILDTDTPTQIL